MLPVSSDLATVTRRFLASQMRFAALQGQAKELHAQKTAIARDIALAKARIELAPQATEVFNYLQEKAHARAVGEFEDLLSAFVADVIPEAGVIRLELCTERGAPALHIRLDNKGDLEDILDGNGGGLTNVVSTGLIYAAQARTATRPLVVLDEPDCWMRAARIPAFTKVIAEVANPRVQADGTQSDGCQTLMISHNDIGLMDEGAHIHTIHVERNLTALADRLGATIVPIGDPAPLFHTVWVPATGSGKPVIEVRYRAGEVEETAEPVTWPYMGPSSGGRAWDNDEQVGIRWIEVENLRRHLKTRIELSPGFNVLAGDVNGGKSTLCSTALRMLAYGEADDSLIRHGADRAVVRVGLEQGIILEAVRIRKGSPKMVFRLYQGGARPLREASGNVPDFITDVLRIERVDDLDIQLRNQKQPVFLLNQSAQRRAQLLSVGKESGLLQELIETHRLALRRDREAVKRDEVTLNQLNCKLRVLEPLTGIAALIEIMTGLQKEAQEAQAQLDSLRTLVGQLVPLTERVALLEHKADILATHLVAPTLTETSGLKALIGRLDTAQGVAALPMPPMVPGLPVLADTHSLARLISRLERSSGLIRLLEQLPSTGPVVPEVVDVQLLSRRVSWLAQRDAELAELAKEISKLEGEFKQASAEHHALQDKLGVCPVCTSAFKKEPAHV